MKQSEYVKARVQIIADSPLNRDRLLDELDALAVKEGLKKAEDLSVEEIDEALGVRNE